MRKGYWLTVILLIGLTLFPTSTLAASLFEHQDTTIPASQAVEDVVVIGGDATVAGTVHNAVVVVNGDVHIRAGAHIQGVVVVIGGRLDQEEGADVTNDVVSIAFDSATVNSLLIGAGLIAGLGAVKLAASLIMIILPVLIVAIGKRKTGAMVERYRAMPRGKLIAIGFFAGVLLFAVCMLLLLTIVGIPFILIVAIFILVALAIGVTIVSQILAEQIRPTADSADWVKAGTGAFLLISMLNIPFIGFVLFVGLLLFSLGVTTSLAASLLRRRKQRKA